MTLYLVMCGTRSDDLILVAKPGLDQALEFAAACAADADFRGPLVDAAFRDLGRDWSEPSLVYVAEVGNGATKYHWLKNGEINQ